MCISVLVSSSEKELYYKSMMWHSICEYFWSFVFFQKFSKQWDFLRILRKLRIFKEFYGMLWNFRDF